MKRIFIALVMLIVTGSIGLRAQQKAWTLEECISYALQNNIQIKQQEITTEYQQSTLDLSKLSLLPTVNGSASHDYSFNRALNQATYEVVEGKRTQSNNFYVGSDMTLFKGLVNYNTIKKNQYQLLASEQDLQNFKDNISLNIALAYLQILLNNELVTATQAQVELTKEQIEHTRKLVDAGSLAKGNLLDIESQAAREELQLVNMQNQLTMSYLALAQMLELTDINNFKVLIPVISIDPENISSNPDSIFVVAQKHRPEILSAEYQLKSAEYDLAIARGGRSPELSLSASARTNYSDAKTYDYTAGEYVDPDPFGAQLKDNKFYAVGFSLNVPIFNGWRVNTNIRNSKLGIENSKYTLESAKKQLYKNIQQAYTDANGALKQYYASKKAVESMEEAYRYAEQKFNVGLLTAVDYNQSKTQLLNAQSEMAQAKYEYVFKSKVLDFYRGIPLTLQQIGILAK